MKSLFSLALFSLSCPAIQMLWPLFYTLSGVKPSLNHQFCKSMWETCYQTVAYLLIQQRQIHINIHFELFFCPQAESDKSSCSFLLCFWSPPTHKKNIWWYLSLICWWASPPPIKYVSMHLKYIWNKNVLGNIIIEWTSHWQQSPWGSIKCAIFFLFVCFLLAVLFKYCLPLLQVKRAKMEIMTKPLSMCNVFRWHSED